MSPAIASTPARGSARRSWSRWVASQAPRPSGGSSTSRDEPPNSGATASVAVGTPSTGEGVSRRARVARASSVASELVGDRRRGGMPTLDVLEHQRHPLAVVVEREEARGRQVVGELPADRRFSAVDAGRVRVLRRADRLDEGPAPGCGRQPVGGPPGRTRRAGTARSTTGDPRISSTPCCTRTGSCSHRIRLPPPATIPRSSHRPPSRATEFGSHAALRTARSAIAACHPKSCVTADAWSRVTKKGHVRADSVRAGPRRRRAARRGRGRRPGRRRPPAGARRRAPRSAGCSGCGRGEPAGPQRLDEHPAGEGRRDHGRQDDGGTERVEGEPADGQRADEQGQAGAPPGQRGALLRGGGVGRGWRPPGIRAVSHR